MQTGRLDSGEREGQESSQARLLLCVERVSGFLGFPDSAGSPGPGGNSFLSHNKELPTQKQNASSVQSGGILSNSLQWYFRASVGVEASTALNNLVCRPYAALRYTSGEARQPVDNTSLSQQRRCYLCGVNAFSPRTPQRFTKKKHLWNFNRVDTAMDTGKTRAQTPVLACKVALMSTTRRSGLLGRRSLRITSRKSASKSRSCT